jgi:hypothetical protein
MLRKERTVEQTEFRGKAKTRNFVCRQKNAEAPKTRRYGIPCDTKFYVWAKTRSSVWDGIPYVPGKHETLCIGRKTPKTRRYRTPCDTKFCVWAKTRKPCAGGKNAETPNSRNSATYSKISGTRPEWETSENLDIRKNGENRRPMKNRLLEQVSSAERRTSGPRRQAGNEGGYGSDADEAWS